MVLSVCAMLAIALSAAATDASTRCASAVTFDGRLATSAAEATADVSVLPPNLRIDVDLTSTLISAWRRSPTFRRQCSRLANAPSLTVVLKQTLTRPTAETRGATICVRDPRSGVLRAEIRIKRSANVSETVELVAHEVEHVIEQLDGVDLVVMERRGAAGVYSIDRGSFETTRAVEIGRRVAREFTESGPSRAKDGAGLRSQERN